MAHDIFISHSARDKAAADMACAVLERNGLRCWIAPRDIRPGADWGTSILEGIKDSRALVLVFSGHADGSEFVRREIERAIHHGITIVPVRIENVLPTGSMEFFLSSAHWMDAITPPLEAHLSKLAGTLRAMLGMPEGPAMPPVPPPGGIGRARGKSAGENTGDTRRALAIILPLIALAVFGGWWIWNQTHKAAAAVALRTLPTTQAAVSARIEAPATTVAAIGKEFVNTLGMKFSRIDGGTFQMGSPEEELERFPDETRHTVTLARYYMGQSDVTRGQFAKFVIDTYYQTEAERDGHALVYIPDKDTTVDQRGASWRNPGCAQKDDHPVVLVSWNDATAYANWLNEKEKGETPRRTYSLPTEARWEFACRNSDVDIKPFNTGDTISTDLANFDGNVTNGTGVKGVYRKGTTPVGQFPANARGLYEMHGNVWQWCYDINADYEKGPLTDPSGPMQDNDTKSLRVLRGGSWKYNPRYLRSAYRGRNAPDVRNNNIGFRLCLDFQ